MASRLHIPQARLASRAIVIGSLFVASVAVAGPTAADRETARTLLEQGRTLTEKGDLKEALKRYKAADDIMHVPSTGVRVAKAQAAVGLLVEARDSLASILRMPEKANDPKPFKDARIEAAQLDAALASRVPSLLITVTGMGEKDELSLNVDGVDVPGAVAGLPRVVNPGHHVVIAKTATATGTGEADVREAEQKRVEITLVSTGVPAPVADQGGGAPEAPAAPVTVHSPTVLTWAGIGLAGAGVIAGAVTGVMSMSKKSTLQTDCPNGICGPTGNSVLSSATTLATVSDITFAAAGAGAVLAAVTLIIGHKKPVEPPAAPPGAEPPPAPPAPAARLEIEPWFGLGAGGVRGTF